MSADVLREAALSILAEHLPVSTYDGILGAVLRCPICGETTGMSPLDALRRHDVAALITARVIPPTEPPTSPGSGDKS